jgi:CheY-like chemotaxis protein
MNCNAVGYASVLSPASEPEISRQWSDGNPQEGARLMLGIPIRRVSGYEACAMEKKRLLVVDDESGSAIACRVVLEQTQRFVVNIELDGANTLAAARAFRPHLILIDRGLPGRTGDELAAALRADEEMKSVPVVIITATPTNEEVARGFGQFPVLPKPFASQELVQIVDRVLAASASGA